MKTLILLTVTLSLAACGGSPTDQHADGSADSHDDTLAGYAQPQADAGTAPEASTAEDASPGPDGAAPEAGGDAHDAGGDVSEAGTTADADAGNAICCQWAGIDAGPGGASSSLLCPLPGDAWESPGTPGPYVVTCPADSCFAAAASYAGSPCYYGANVPNDAGYGSVIGEYQGTVVRCPRSCP